MDGIPAGLGTASFMVFVKFGAELFHKRGGFHICCEIVYGRKKGWLTARRRVFKSRSLVGGDRGLGGLVVNG